MRAYLAFLAGLLAIAVGATASAHLAGAHPTGGAASPRAAAANDDGAVTDRPAKLQINRARVRDQRLIVRGSLDAAAAGEELMVTFRAAGRERVLETTVRPDGVFRVAQPLLGPQRRVQAGVLRVHFAGNEALREATQRIRAALRPVRLRIQRAVVQGNLVVAAGRVAPRARRQVRAVIEFNRRDGSPAQLLARAEVDEEGGWRFRRNVPVAARNLGAWLSVTHPGRARLHGQRRGVAVGG